MNIRFAIIGFGAITDEIVCTLRGLSQLEALVAVLVKSQHFAEAQRKAAGSFAVIDSLDRLYEFEPDIVAECAGHNAVHQLAPKLLEHGLDILCSSVGALANETLVSQVKRFADRATLWIPSGAIAGVDGLLAARTAGLERVTYTSIKPPIAWKGTPAESILDGLGLSRRTTFFNGSARQAAIAYPQNANVAATVALAGLGLDETSVSLVSDPAVNGPLGVIEASGKFGMFRFEILAYASSTNPKTSLLAAHSIIAALQAEARFSPYRD